MRSSTTKTECHSSRCDPLANHRHTSLSPATRAKINFSNRKMRPNRLTGPPYTHNRGRYLSPRSQTTAHVRHIAHSLTRSPSIAIATKQYVCTWMNIFIYVIEREGYIAIRTNYSAVGSHTQLFCATRF